MRQRDASLSLVPSPLYLLLPFPFVSSFLPPNHPAHLLQRPFLHQHGRVSLPRQYILQQKEDRSLDMIRAFVKENNTQSVVRSGSPLDARAAAACWNGAGSGSGSGAGSGSGSGSGSSFDSGSDSEADDKSWDQVSLQGSEDGRSGSGSEPSSNKGSKSRSGSGSSSDSGSDSSSDCE
jgi:hypothetical protein